MRLEMRFLILLLLNIVLTFDIAIPTPTVIMIDIPPREMTNAKNNPMNYRLPKDVIPIYYLVNLDIRVTEKDVTFDGKTRIVIEVQQPTRTIVFHSHNLFLNMQMTTLSGISSNTMQAMRSYQYHNETQTMVLTYEEMLIGRYDLELVYRGNLKYSSDGFFLTTDGNETNKTLLVSTQFNPIGARRLFPCWDEPAFKATFDITLKHSKKYNVISNMGKWLVEPANEPGVKWTKFLTTPKISTYLVGIAFTTLNIVAQNEVVDIWGNPDLERRLIFALEAAKKIKNTLIKYTNFNPITQKINFIVMPEKFEAIRMWGLIIYSERCLVVDDHTDNLGDKIHVATSIAQGMVPMWFGDLVSPAWWTDKWLNEGVDTYIETQILQKIFKTWRIEDIFVVKILQDALYKKINFHMHSVIESTVEKFGESELLHSLHSYKSDFILIRMLVHIVSKKVFQVGVIKYIEKFNFDSATPAQFWATLQSVLEELYPTRKDVVIQNIAASWLDEKSFPLLTVSRDYDTGQITIFQQPYECNMIPWSVWWYTPITITAQSSFNFSNTFPKYWLTEQNRSVIVNGFKKDDWIVVNLQQAGYYRVNYDDTNWARLVKVLNSERYIHIHVLNRAQLIDDAYYLLLKNSVEFSCDIFFDLVGYLKRETDHIPWYPMTRILKDLSHFFYSPRSEYVKSRFLALFGDVIKNVGYDSKNNESESTKIIRSLATYWACKLGHVDCLSRAAEKLNAHLENPTGHIIPPKQLYWTYCMGMMGANLNTAIKMYNQYKQSNDTNNLKYMSCARNYDVLTFYLDLLVTKDRVYLKLKDRNNFYYQMVEQHAYDERVFDLLLKDFNILSQITIPATDRIIHIIRNVYSKKLIDKVSEFVVKNIYDTYINKTEVHNAVTIKLEEMKEMIFIENRFNPPEKHTPPTIPPTKRQKRQLKLPDVTTFLHKDDEYECEVWQKYD